MWITNENDISFNRKKKKNAREWNAKQYRIIIRCSSFVLLLIFNLARSRSFSHSLRCKIEHFLRYKITIKTNKNLQWNPMKCNMKAKENENTVCEKSARKRKRCTIGTKKWNKIKRRMNITISTIQFTSSFSCRWQFYLR